MLKESATTCYRCCRASGVRLREQFLARLEAQFQSVSRRGGRNKGGRKQMRANASKRRQTRTNASKRRGANLPNASKREQTWANVDKRKQTLTPPLLRFFTFYTPLCNPQFQRMVCTVRETFLSGGQKTPQITFRTLHKHFCGLELLWHSYQGRGMAKQ